MSHNVSKDTFWHMHPMKTQISAHRHDQSLCCQHEERLHPWLSKMCPVKVSDQTAGMHTSEGTFSYLAASFFFFFWIKMVGFLTFPQTKTWCAMYEKSPYAICGQHRPRSACAYAQADQGLLCQLTEPVDTVVYADKQKIPRLDCTDTHADLDLWCPQIA